MRLFSLLMLLLVPWARAEDPAVKAAGEQPGPTAAALDVVDLADVLEPLRAEAAMPSLVAAVVNSDGLLGAGAVGVRAAKREARVGLTDKFHIGSCTKSMTGFVCAALVEQGKLKWSSTVGEVFADQKDAIRAEWLPVTLEQLLCHRSGLPEDRSPDKVFFQLRRLSGPLLEQRRALVEIVLAQEPANDPGTVFAYSNNGIALAAAMAERVTGKTCEELMQSLLFKPLEMGTAGFGPPGDGGQLDQPWGHRMTQRLMPIRPSPFADNPPVTGPAGNVHCSILDWARYAQLQLQAARGEAKLLSSKMFAKLYSDPFAQGYAFGWGMRTTETGRMLRHAGSNTMWFAVVQVELDANLAIVIATNCATKPAMDVFPKVAEAVQAKVAAEKEE